jgi:SHS2 domain-containing protein
MNHRFLNYQVIDHTADLGMIVQGADVKRLFIDAAHAMLDLMVKGDMSEWHAKREISIAGDDFADLMVRWLGEILYLFYAERLLTTGVVIKSISSTKLRAQLSFARFRKARHKVIREIKAVTYHQIQVEEKDDGWEARVIFDI